MQERLVLKWQINIQKELDLPIEDHKMDGDKNIQAFRISNGDHDEDNISVWFWRGSEYFEIDCLNSR